MRRLTTQEFIERAKSVHGDRYDYSHVNYEHAHKPVEIVCKVHGSFWQEPGNHLKGAGCSLCNKVDARKMTLDEFIRKALTVHGDKYDYSKVQYVNSKVNVKIICPEHGVFEQTPNKHLVGQGCPLCASNHKDDTASFIRKAIRVHGDKYDYSKVKYVDEHTKVCIIDKQTGDEFWQQPNSHLNGRGNPLQRMAAIQAIKCERYGEVSSEKRAYDALVSRFGEDDVRRDYWTKAYPFACDFYVVSLNLYIEINAHPAHGGHFFDKMNPEDVELLLELLQNSDADELCRTTVRTWSQYDVKKRETALANDLNYLVFWDWQLSDFFKWFDNFDPENPVLKNV